MCGHVVLFQFKEWPLRLASIYRFEYPQKERKFLFARHNMSIFFFVHLLPSFFSLLHFSLSTSPFHAPSLNEGGGGEYLPTRNLCMAPEYKVKNTLLTDA
jgi:hypothetical protein